MTSKELNQEPTSGCWYHLFKSFLWKGRFLVTPYVSVMAVEKSRVVVRVYQMLLRGFENDVTLS